MYLKTISKRNLIGTASSINRRFASHKVVRNQISYSHGTSDKPLLCEHISQKLRHTTEKFPESMALISHHQNIQLTYEQFNREVDEVARGLVALGLNKGDRVGIYSPNRAEWVLLQFAAARANLILVNVNPAFQ